MVIHHWIANLAQAIDTEECNNEQLFVQTCLFVLIHGEPNGEHAELFETILSAAEQRAHVSVFGIMLNGLFGHVAALAEIITSGSGITMQYSQAKGISDNIQVSYAGHEQELMYATGSHVLMCHPGGLKKESAFLSAMESLNIALPAIKNMVVESAQKVSTEALGFMEWVMDAFIYWNDNPTLPSLLVSADQGADHDLDTEGHHRHRSGKGGECRAVERLVHAMISLLEQCADLCIASRLAAAHQGDGDVEDVFMIDPLQIQQHVHAYGSSLFEKRSPRLGSIFAIYFVYYYNYMLMISKHQSSVDATDLGGYSFVNETSQLCGPLLLDTSSFDVLSELHSKFTFLLATRHPSSIVSTSSFMAVCERSPTPSMSSNQAEQRLWRQATSSVDLPSLGTLESVREFLLSSPDELAVFDNRWLEILDAVCPLISHMSSECLNSFRSLWMRWVDVLGLRVCHKTLLCLLRLRNDGREEEAFSESELAGNPLLCFNIDVILIQHPAMLEVFSCLIECVLHSSEDFYSSVLECALYNRLSASGKMCLSASSPGSSPPLGDGSASTSLGSTQSVSVNNYFAIGDNSPTGVVGNPTSDGESATHQNAFLFQDSWSGLQSQTQVERLCSSLEKQTANVVQGHVVSVVQLLIELMCVADDRGWLNNKPSAGAGSGGGFSFSGGEWLSLLCECIQRLLIQYPLAAETVHMQTYSHRVVPTLVQLVPSMFGPSVIQTIHSLLQGKEDRRGSLPQLSRVSHASSSVPMTLSALATHCAMSEERVNEQIQQFVFGLYCLSWLAKYPATQPTVVNVCLHAVTILKNLGTLVLASLRQQPDFVISSFSRITEVFPELREGVISTFEKISNTWKREHDKNKFMLSPVDHMALNLLTKFQRDNAATIW